MDVPEQRNELLLEHDARPMEPHLDRSDGDAERFSRFDDTQLLNIAEQKDLTVDQRQIRDRLLQELADLLSLQYLRRDLLPISKKRWGDLCVAILRLVERLHL